MGGSLGAGWRAVALPRLLLLVLVACAYSPLLRAGLLAPDYARLLGNPREVGHPLSAWWLDVSRALYGIPPPGASAWPYRLEHLALLLGVALALRTFLARLLAPWVGAVHAQGAGGAAAILLLLHPLAPLVVASLAARGELAGLFFGAVAATFFLWGRQEGREALTVVSFFLLLISGLASAVAVAIALILAAAEFLSAKRHRRRALRLRTALTTAGLFGAGAALPTFLGWALGARASVSSASVGAWDVVHEEVARHLEQLGELVLPLRYEALGVAGLLCAAGLFFLALQPGFRAARNAPRLWGGLLLGWSGGMLCALARWAPCDAPGDSTASARSLLALAVMAAGMGLTASALSGARRVLLCMLLATGYGALAHVRARPWLHASAAVRSLQAELVALAPAPGEPLFVLEPPVSIEGLDPVGHEIGWLLHPALSKAAAGKPFDPGRVRALSSAAFLRWSREPEFARLRQEPLRVLAPRSAWGETGGGRVAIELRPEDTRPTPLRPWRKDLTFNVEEGLDPCAYDAARIVTELSTPARELERLAWRNRANERAFVTGSVRELGAQQVAFYDLSRSLAWRLSGRVFKLLVDKGARPIEGGELLERVPALEGFGEPDAQGGDWLFPRSRAALPVPEPGGRFVLTLLALSDYEFRELPLESGPGDSLRASGAQHFVAGKGSPGVPVAWSLDYRIGEQCLARNSGRRP